MKQAITFEEWEKQVDFELHILCGMGIDFLPDWNSYSAFYEGMKPKAAAKAWYKAAQDCY